MEPEPMPPVISITGSGKDQTTHEHTETEFDGFLKRMTENKRLEEGPKEIRFRGVVLKKL